MNRTVRAFLITPLVPAVLFVFTVSLVGLVSKNSVQLQEVMHSIPIWLFYSLPVSFGVAVIVGIPGYLLFRHFGFLSAKALSLAASALGFLVGGTVGALFNEDALFTIMAVAIVSALWGALTGFCFWWLSYRAVT